MSDLGRVRRGGKILKLSRHCHGYYRVHLSRHGKTAQPDVHRLVAEAFVPNPLGLETVNHRDENKANNSAANLEWLTRGDNARYSLNVPVRQFRLDGTLVAEYLSVREAERQTGIAHNHISYVARGKGKSAGGYVWRYAQGKSLAEGKA